MDYSTWSTEALEDFTGPASEAWEWDFDGAVEALIELDTRQSCWAE